MTRIENNCALWMCGYTIHTVEYQKHVCEQYAKEQGLHVKGYYGGVMNGTAGENKEKLMTMIRNVKEDESISKIICSDLICIGSNTYLMQLLINELYDTGVSIVIVNRDIEIECSMEGFIIFVLIQHMHEKKIDELFPEDDND